MTGTSRRAKGPGRQRTGLSPSGVSEAGVDAGLAHGHLVGGGERDTAGFYPGCCERGGHMGWAPWVCVEDGCCRMSPGLGQGLIWFPWWTTVGLEPGGMGSQKQSYH